MTKIAGHWLQENRPLIRSFVAFLLGFGVVSISVTFASDFPELVSKVPGNANSIMLVDVEGILASPIATTNGWSKRFADGNADRPLYLPPEADKVVVGAQFDVVRGFAQIWEVALMGMKEPFSMSLVARAEGGHLDSISGVSVAWVPSDAYFIEVDKQTLGLMAPADRQAIARWADNSKKAVTGPLSAWLSNTTQRVGRGTQAVIAIETANAIQPHRVQARLQQFNLDKSLDLNAISQLISSMQGIILEVSFGRDVQATATISFAMPVKLSDSAAKNLVLQTMESMGMSLPGTEDWKCSVSTNSITMSGELISDSVRRVFSLMEVPTTKFSSLKDQPIEEASGDDTAALSLKYFQSIDAMLTDLRERTKSSTAGDSGWLSRYAAKIDRLPMLHVDEELLTYGEQLSETLHIMAGARKMTNLQGASAARANRSTAGFSSGYDDGYGYRNYNYNSPRSAEASAQNAIADATAAGTSVKIQGWKLIDEATLEIRRTMTKRYNIEF